MLSIFVFSFKIKLGTFQGSLPMNETLSILSQASFSIFEFWLLFWLHVYRQVKNKQILFNNIFLVFQNKRFTMVTFVLIEFFNL